MVSEADIKEFMGRFFTERTQTKKSVLEMRRPYRERYYHRDCLWDSRRGSVEASESERIVSVEPSAEEVLVVTREDSKRDSGSRYHINLSGKTWMITEVDMECLHCRHFSYLPDCTHCAGTGWLSSQQRKKSWEALISRATGPHPADALKPQLVHDSGIDTFMTEHFRERTIVLKMETELYTKFANGFFGQDFDWTRSIVSVRNGESECILGTEWIGGIPHVVTRGFGLAWGGYLRYRLRPKAQSWLIDTVDSECLNCLRHGWSQDCIMCGGTVWEQKFRR